MAFSGRTLAGAASAKVDTASPGFLSDDERERLAEVADELIPLPMTWRRLTRWASPTDWSTECSRCALIWPSAALGPSMTLATLDPSLLRAVRTVVAGAYYLSPDVRARLGNDTDPAGPVRVEPYPAYIDEGLLDHLLRPPVCGRE